MIFEMGDLIGLQAKQGGSRKGSNFRPIVKKPTTWAKKGGSGPPGPSPLDPPMHLQKLIGKRNTRFQEKTCGSSKTCGISEIISGDPVLSIL